VLGVIESFDERRGDGEVLGDDERRYYLHCVEIADGSRVVTVGSRVAFTPRAGLVGRDEASELQTFGVVDRRT
jgi:hypothetical protein